MVSSRNCPPPEPGREMREAMCQQTAAATTRDMPLVAFHKQAFLVSQLPGTLAHVLHARWDPANVRQKWLQLWPAHPRLTQLGPHPFLPLLSLRDMCPRRAAEPSEIHQHGRRQQVECVEQLSAMVARTTAQRHWQQAGGQKPPRKPTQPVLLPPQGSADGHLLPVQPARHGGHRNRAVRLLSAQQVELAGLARRDWRVLSFQKAQLAFVPPLQCPSAGTS
mmetsp:Transcript_63097/g.179387  ORF Transcript_63097/g.179387 Transcript_63097/m.179387 type:complete len:221 (-) Transcript_63097:475-1137(-)